ncbi:RICIN domain-containing protein [Streptomyces sp. DH37]|uniref:RICIN domain-containing protein n=1 Tax=Streptomyces sp. DH37 TaxID=3040122 RepID=UPI0024418609|nr:RICIN domain-containing protein [Streptomyces sp. DH37]MDG9702546.1 RICIN domain-containing protein [Streptomyces sp. DH37]
MRRALHIILRMAIAVCVGLLPSAVVGQANAAPVTVTNGVQFTDSDGKVLHGHGGGMIRVGQYYYWFGENPHSNNRFRYISVYRSTDLRTWEFRNNVLTQTSAAELDVATLWRPKVVYNARTKQYVLFMRKERREGDFSQGRVAIATSPRVDGDYRYRGSFRPLGHKSFDVSVFRDDDGTAYLISTTNRQKDLTVFRLTPDYLRVAAKVTTLAGVEREAQTVFKRKGVYFLVTSGVTGWQPNQAKYATATSIAGPWSGMANLGDSITYGSQSSYVLPVQGTSTTSYLYLGDRHANAWGGRVKDSEYVWLPLRFPSSRSLSMRWHPQVSIDTATGVVRGVGAGHAYEELRAGHNDRCLAVRWSSMADGAGVTQQTCGTAADQNQHWQTLHLGAGYHRLVARHSHKCLTVPSSSTADNVRVTQRTCGTGANQQWRITGLGEGHHRVTARHSGKCLTIAYDPATAGPKAIQYTCKATANQQWKRTGGPY